MKTDFVSKLTTLSFVLSLLAFGTPQLRAQSVYTGEHGDLGIEYTPGETEFEPHWHLHEGAIVDGSALTEEGEYAPSDLVAQTSSTSTATSTIASWLGISTGATLWTLGTEIHQPELGFGTEELTDSEWLDSTITISLSGWALGNPGDVILVDAGNTLRFSTVAGSSVTNDWAFDLAAGHAHLAWYFTNPGDYQLIFTWSGTYIGEDGTASIPVTGTGTFGFSVVPEPGTWALIAGAGLGLFAIVHRRRALRQA
ncbi:anchor protein [Opitutaceae bacterium TAV5]|nr:anchor protein [Opitutaceae bacterium TAV5]